jgi:hypothetical protein
MKKFLILAGSVFLLVGAGCATKPAPVPLSETVPTAPQVRTVAMRDVFFVLPAEWEATEVVHKSNKGGTWDETALRVPDPAYHVSIPFSFGKTDVSVKGQSPILTTPSGADIYADDCAPAIACYLIAYKGSVYSAGFGAPKSDEPAPANPEGPWFPSTTVTASQTLQFVSSIK